MDNFNRNKDLTQVFEERWNANRNNKDFAQARKDFNFKMYGIRDKEDVRKEMREFNSVASKVDRLNQRISAMNNMNNNSK